MKIGKKLLAAITSTALAVSLCPAAALTAFAETGTIDQVASMETSSKASAAATEQPVFNTASVTPLTKTIGTCVCTMDANGVLTIKPASGSVGKLPTHGDDVSGSAANGAIIGGWDGNGTPLKDFNNAVKVVIQGKIVLAPNSTGLFRNFSDMTSITLASGGSLDTSGVTTMSGFFENCSSLTNISALANIDTRNVTDLTSAFSWCTSLADISALSKWNTFKVTCLDCLFQNCQALTNLTSISNWDTSKVQFMRRIFDSCTSLTSTKSLKNWKTSSVNEMFGMFSGCSKLTDLSGLSTWNTASVTYFGYMWCINGMFAGCQALKDLSPLSSWNVSKATSMIGMFSDCTSLTNMSALANWNTSSVRYLDYMFDGCPSLSDLSGLAKWNTRSLESISCMFNKCTSLTNISALSSWNVSKLKVLSSMSYGIKGTFMNCTSLNDISGLARWDTSSVEYIDGLFFGCTSLSDISPLANWNMTKVESSTAVFGELAMGGGYAPIKKAAFGYGWTKAALEGSGLWDPSGKSVTGKWISANAKVKGPLTTEQLIGNWKPSTMAGVWVAQGSGVSAVTTPLNQLFSLTRASVSVKNVTYAGKAATPVPAVKLDGRKLSCGTDFKVTYKNNSKAGTATATVTGIGAYTGKQSVSFKIAKANLKNVKLTNLVSRAYTGKAIKQVPTVKLGSVTLKKNRDFTVSWKSNTKIGTATVTVKGKGSCTGSKSAKFKIVKYKQPMTVKAKKSTVQVKASTLKGKAVTLANPLIVKKAKGKIAYSNASTNKVAKTFTVNARTGKVTVKKGTAKGTYQLKVKVVANGSGNYAYGSKTVAVKIKVK